MQYLVTGKEMQLYDRTTREQFHVPELVLMEQAANAFVETLLRLEREEHRHWEQALILCGSGNNGADGLAIARLLTLQGRTAAICPIGEHAGQRATDSYRVQREICAAYGIREVPWEEAGEYGLIVDALFGVGLSRPVQGVFAEAIEAANLARAWRVAADISSGISADTGAVFGTAFCADDTITFAFGKLGQYLWRGNEYSGRVHVAPIGITQESFLCEPPKTVALDRRDLVLPARMAHSNKGTYGRLLLVAGSVNMAGAACLCARAAYRSGCGLVQVLTAEENRLIVQTAVPEAILTTYGNEPDTDTVVSLVHWADAVVIGPGLGTSAAADVILRAVMDAASVPLVLDADALNLLARDIGRLSAYKAKGRIVTPHLGEMARLTGKTIGELQEDLCGAAGEFAETFGVVCVLKDFRTVTAVPGGKRFLNLSGNPGMATAGSGDVLAGILGGLLAQGMKPEDMAQAVYLHGLAGDMAASAAGMRALTAGDIVGGLSLLKKEGFE